MYIIPNLYNYTTNIMLTLCETDWKQIRYAILREYINTAGVNRTFIVSYNYGFMNE